MASKVTVVTVGTMATMAPRWKHPQGPLPPQRASPGYCSPGSGHQDHLSHEATKATMVSVITTDYDPQKNEVTKATKATSAIMSTMATMRPLLAPLVPHRSWWPLFSMAPLAQTLALLAITAATAAITVVPLDMAQDSFDDQYLKCRDKMTEKLRELKRSDFLKNHTFFERIWTNAMAECQTRGCYSSSLTKDQAVALMAYTMGDLYDPFNAAVRTAGKSSQEYRDNFHFKTLHFLLTQALQKLRSPAKCLDVFRGVDRYQFEVKTGAKVRFGQFTLSSLDKTVAKRYGTDTMFEVHTCQGADIHNFSFNQREKEVLIPPFETFEVTKVKMEGSTLNIGLRSTGNSSNYDCEWLRGGSLPRNSPYFGGLLLATVAMAVVTGTL
ncbi:erythroblast NAD(P)(+)--arginine ADP-ribosyltransferase-like [Serinus canaria]|uniref:erythroblast NAD(P)(+)--arginine ADP-ribosyltransferase-like n=1 Tax=Serinus canaria TaxID=9135 RepID=UPI0021CCCCDA|nr:erythroblast NAD(P)(+)--arginine ADP-ribosyltransferase-like [Serinus canaria]